MPKLKHYFALLMLILSKGIVFGQTDSIKTLIKEETNAKVKFDLYLALGNEFRSISIDSSTYYFQMAQDWAQNKMKGSIHLAAANELAYDKIKSNDIDRGKAALLDINEQLIDILKDDEKSSHPRDLVKTLVLNYEYLGLTVRRQDSLLQALNYFESAIEECYKIADIDLLADLFGDAAQTYYLIGNFPKSLEYCLRGIKVNEKRNNIRGVASNTGNAGILFKEMGEYEKALEYFTAALEIHEELGNQRSIAINLGNIGVAYDKMKNYDLALEYYEKAAKLHEELGSTEGLIYNYNNMALVFETQGDYDKAIGYFNQSLAFSEELDNNYTYTNTSIYLAGAYNKKGDYKKAQMYLDRAEEYCFKLGALDMMSEFYELQSSVYENIGQFKKSLDYYKEFVLIQDSILNEKSLRQVIQLETNFKMEQKIAQDSLDHIKELALHQAESDQKKAELRAARYLQYGMSGGLVLLLAFIYLINKRFRVSRKQNSIISAQKETLQRQNEAVESARQSLEEKQKEIVDSINYAKRIQGAILPPDSLFKEVFPESFVLYKPKDIVAGDFYWLEVIDDLIYVAAADCTGHGVPGAMVSVVCHNALNRCVRELNLKDPGKILDAAKQMIIAEFEKSEEEVKDGMDISLCVIKKSGENQLDVDYAGAHNSLLIIKNGSKEVDEIKADRCPVGKYYTDIPFTTHKVKLSSGDQIYMTTDGYFDQFGGDDKKKFKSLNFRKLLLQVKNRSMPDQKDQLNQVFENWKGNIEQIDDVCVIGIRI